ncbi:MAG: gliding motility protein GldM [Prevotellaceae bacterium]|jgi:gliding motility-associated protein GldM|nr:gliding motility protein GldM [Prevotellaceae bacterium]
MAGGNLTPRQKMINMMYLVLTAMLALNVSAEVLNAFVLIDIGINKSIGTIREKNIADVDDFAKAMADNPEKVAPWKIKADSVHARTNALYSRIHNLKIRLIRASDGKDAPAIVKDSIDVELIEGQDNTDVAPSIMLGEMNSGEAYKLRNEINQYKQFLLNLINDPGSSSARSIEDGLQLKDPPMTSDGTNRTWEASQFESIPLISAIALLSKQQMDIVNCESEALKYLQKQIDASDFKFSDIDVAIIPDSKYVLKGSEYRADIFLAAYDPTQRPVFVTNHGQNWRSGDKGKIEFKQMASSVGRQQVIGNVEFMGPSGKTTVPLRFEYEVAEPNIVVSPTKMNVVYRGVDNPMSISLSGVSLDRLEPRVTNGTISRRGNEFFLRPGSGRMCDVSVILDGTQNMGTLSFRVKDIPTPTAAVYGIASKTVNKNELAVAEGVVAEMKDFDFDLKYDVTSFTVFVTIDGYANEETSKSKYFTDKQKQIISRVRSGQRVSFTDIKAKGPDGKEIELSDFSLRLR